MELQHPPQRKALGQFIQARRQQLQPRAVGLPEGMRRRTPGLRREELAQLCGISVTWLTWIEQGRPASVSPQTLAHLAEALRLTRAERAYLFELAAKKDPAAGEPVEAVPPAAARAVEQIRGPAYLLDRYWDAVAWNRPAQALIPDWLDRSSPSRNLLRFMFCSPAAPALIPDWETRARRLVAEFRADTGHYPSDPHLLQLVEDLQGRSGAFGRYWQDQDVEEREGGERIFRHSSGALLIYQQVTLLVANRPDLKLVLLIAADPGEMPPSPTQDTG